MPTENHIHRVSEIRLRGKPDSVYVVCECLETEAVSVWTTAAPKGWEYQGWHQILKAIGEFLDYQHLQMDLLAEEK